MSGTREPGGAKRGAASEFGRHFACIPTLVTERLTLRAFTPDDLGDYLRMVRDPEVQRHLGGGLVDLPNGKHAANWLRNINGRLLQSRTVFTWCVERAEDRAFVGRIDLGGFERKAAAELSYYLAREAWGRGYATEAVRRVVAFGLDTLGLRRIQAAVLPENPASLRVLEKAGFIREGRMRNHPFGREIHDIVMTAVIRDNDGAARPRAHLIAGRVCAGKSVYAERLRRTTGGVVLSADEAMLALYGEVPEERFTTCLDAVRAYLLERAADLLRAGTDVILDWGFWTREDRRRTRAFFAERGYRTTLYSLEISPERRLGHIRRRNAAVRAGAAGVYPVDEGLAAKCDALYEPPEADEIDVRIADEDLYPEPDDPAEDNGLRTTDRQ